jgi:hypothetical protein
MQHNGLIEHNENRLLARRNIFNLLVDLRCNFLEVTCVRLFLNVVFGLLEILPQVLLIKLQTVHCFRVILDPITVLNLNLGKLLGASV